MIRLVYPYFNKAGGVERYLVELAQALLRRGQDLELVGHEFDPDCTAGIATRRIPSLPLPQSLRLLWFNIAEAMMTRPPNGLTHTQGVTSLRADIVQAQSCHKAWFLESLAELRPFSKAWLLKLANPIHYVVIALESLQYRLLRPRMIVAISAVVRKQIIKHFGVPEGLVRVVYSGVNTEEFRPPDPEERSRLRHTLGITGEDTIALAFVGHEFRRKNLASVIKAVARLNDQRYQLFVAGKDDPRPFEELSERLGVAHQVNFLGTSHALPELYGAADIFVFPTTHDAFGLVITEAMATGLPVITGPEAGAAELIANGENGTILSDVFDADEIAACIRDLSNSDRAQAMGRAARATAERYTWDHVAEKMVALYDEIRDPKQRELSLGAEAP